MPPAEVIIPVEHLASILRDATELAYWSHQQWSALDAVAKRAKAPDYVVSGEDFAAVLRVNQEALLRNANHAMLTATLLAEGARPAPLGWRDRIKGRLRRALD